MRITIVQGDEEKHERWEFNFLTDSARTEITLEEYVTEFWQEEHHGTGRWIPLTKWSRALSLVPNAYNEPEIPPLPKKVTEKLYKEIMNGIKRWPIQANYDLLKR